MSGPCRFFRYSRDLDREYTHLLIILLVLCLPSCLMGFKHLRNDILWEFERSLKADLDVRRTESAFAPPSLDNLKSRGQRFVLFPYALLNLPISLRTAHPDARF